MEDSLTTHQESAGVHDSPGSYAHSGHYPPPLGDPAQQPWSPVVLSSPSASTEYWSTDPSPAGIIYSLPQSQATFSFWCEQVTWSAPPALEGCYVHRRPESAFEDIVFDDPEFIPETPEELVDTLTQDEVEKPMREMTCGPKLEEHFWPIRYSIRSGKLQLYENTIKTLIIEARSDRLRTFDFSLLACEEPPSVHRQFSKLTRELASYRETSSSLTRFLDESRNLYERLWQVCTHPISFVHLVYKFDSRLPANCEQVTFNSLGKPFGKTIS
ncbi:hypothetical protein B0H14DRAFT_199159 [Mycena olivaceomarginata]|nr:hypothetical protein B0H14DRAFT_199159 [Mycena olivaceomarginata]